MKEKHRKRKNVKHENIGVVFSIALFRLFKWFSINSIKVIIILIPVFIILLLELRKKLSKHFNKFIIEFIHLFFLTSDEWKVKEELMKVGKCKWYSNVWLPINFNE